VEQSAEVVFWVSIGALVHTYALYPIALFFLASLGQGARDLKFLLDRMSRRVQERAEFLPQVALLVAAYNEETVIDAKLGNVVALNYPPGRLEFLLGLDCPTDSTAARVAAFGNARFRPVAFPVRRGKLAVLLDLVPMTTAEILVLSDANTMLEPDAIRKVVRHFADPNVGAVCGEARISSADGTPHIESAYWRYEIMLKFLENRLNCVLGANGAIFAVRASLYKPRPGAIVEDFESIMQIRHQGFRVVYDPEAVGRETAAPTLTAEFRRQVRISAGNFQTLVLCPRFLNPLRGMPTFAYVSHKVLRWLGPFWLVGVLGSSLLLAWTPFYAGALLLQLVCYAMALAGYRQQRRGRVSKILAAPLFFVVMNAALFRGLLDLIAGRQRAVWEASPRQLGSSSEAATVRDPSEAQPPPGRRAGSGHRS
jgi:cellulose synthase/poly-beta-1,6-N-acetylglucosamine synthase-like glycosyltransferase